MLNQWLNFAQMNDVWDRAQAQQIELDRFLANRIKYRKVGDEGCPIKEADDPTIVKFASENNLVIITKDAKMIEQCEFEEVPYVTYNDVDFAKKIVNYSESN